MSFHGLIGPSLISPDRRSGSTEYETWNATHDAVLSWPRPLMVHCVLIETAASLSEHKKNPLAKVAAGEGMAVAVLNHRPEAGSTRGCRLA